MLYPDSDNHRNDESESGMDKLFGLIFIGSLLLIPLMVLYNISIK